MNKNLMFYKEACLGEDWQSQKLSELAQSAQEDFYGKWIQQMVRIAKVRECSCCDGLVDANSRLYVVSRQWYFVAWQASDYRTGILSVL